jgi:hypothetical protein
MGHHVAKIGDKLTKPFMDEKWMAQTCKACAPHALRRRPWSAEFCQQASVFIILCIGLLLLRIGRLPMLVA